MCGAPHRHRVVKWTPLQLLLFLYRIFGSDIIRRCAPAGSKDPPTLLKAEPYQLKTVMFQQLPSFWHKPDTFEKVWKNQCWTTIEQACKWPQKTSGPPPTLTVVVYHRTWTSLSLTSALHTVILQCRVCYSPVHFGTRQHTQTYCIYKRRFLQC